MTSSRDTLASKRLGLPNLTASSGNGCMSHVDEALLARVAEGDKEAFAEFYDRTAGRVLGFLLRFLPQRCEAEDVLQETFWQVWVQARRYDDGRSSPVAWVLLPARSRAMDSLRRKRVREMDPLASAPQAAHEDPTHHGREEWRTKATEALLRLPREQSSLIGLAFYEGWTHEEIARRAKLPLGTVKTRIRRGMISLKEALGTEVERHCP